MPTGSTAVIGETDVVFLGALGLSGGELAVGGGRARGAVNGSYNGRDKMLWGCLIWWEGVVLEFGAQSV